jgi:hypothetical protein
MADMTISVRGNCGEITIEYRIGIAEGTAKGYGLNGQGSIPDSARIFSSLQCPPSVLSNEYRKLFSRGGKLTTHLHLMPRLIMVELCLQSHVFMT